MQPLQTADTDLGFAVGQCDLVRSFDDTTLSVLLLAEPVAIAVYRAPGEGVVPGWTVHLKKEMCGVKNSHFRGGAGSVWQRQCEELVK